MGPCVSELDGTSHLRWRNPGLGGDVNTGDDLDLPPSASLVLSL